METNNSDTYIQSFVSVDISAVTYYIESKGEAVIVDPTLVDSPKVKALLAQRKSKLRYVLLTHVPSEYVSGYAEFENAQVVVGSGLELTKPLRSAQPNEILHVGDLKIQAHSTGRHSPASVSYVVKGLKEADSFILGGADLIYGGGVFPNTNIDGQQDNQKPLAMSLGAFKVAPEAKVYPAYKNSGFFKYIKEQKQIYTLKEVLDNQTLNPANNPYPIPPWTAQVYKTNLSGPPKYNTLKESFNKDLTMDQFDSLRAKAIVLDIRQQIPDLQKGTISGSFIIPPNGCLGLFVQFLFKQGKSILIICKKELRQSIIDRLINIGTPTILGFNNFAMTEWIQSSKSKSIPQFASIKDVKFGPSSLIIDCRTPTQWKEEGIVDGAKCVYFPDIEKDLQKHKEEYKKYESVYHYCRLGYRARIAGSLFDQAGFSNSYIIPESFAEIKEVAKIVPYKQE